MSQKFISPHPATYQKIINEHHCLALPSITNLLLNTKINRNMQGNKKSRRLVMNQRSFKKVEVTGLEPATAWSQTRNATNCATPRCFAAAKVLNKNEITKE